MRLLVTAADGERRHEAAKLISAEGSHVSVLAQKFLLRRSSADPLRDKLALRNIYPVTTGAHYVRIREHLPPTSVRENFGFFLQSVESGGADNRVAPRTKFCKRARTCACKCVCVRNSAETRNRQSIIIFIFFFPERSAEMNADETVNR